MQRQLVSRFNDRAFNFRSSQPLTDDQLQRYAPSVFAEDAHSSRSERYACIPTIHVLRALQSEGFQPFMVAQMRCHNESKQAFTKHMLRLRHAEHIGGGEANEIILLNSHDGSSSYQMLAGIFRDACSNGMVWGRAAADIRIPHKGDVAEEVVDGAFTVLEEFGRIDASKAAMKAVLLDQEEQLALANAALALRYDPDAAAPISNEQLLAARRGVDQGRDLWRTFNRIQENLLRGGLRGRSANGRKLRTREITSIDQDVRLNRALWILAEAMQAAKAEVTSA